MNLAVDPARVAEAVVAALDAVNGVEPRTSHQHAASVARYDDSTTECVGDPGMPGPQDQVPGPQPPVREAVRPDTSPMRETDTPREGQASRTALHERLERLPPNHPSSPFREDGPRKPPPPDVRNLGHFLPAETGEDTASPDRNSESADSPGTGKPASANTDHAHAHADDPGKPRIDPDGSWDWKGRHLTPDQSRAGDQTLEICRSAEGRDVDGNYGEHGLTPAMRRIEAQLEHGRLADGTEDFALKSPDRFKEKLSQLIQDEPDKSVEEHATDIHDGVRYTFLFDRQEYTKGIENATSLLESAGYEFGVRKNTWANEEYKGINTRWRDYISGIRFEIQFHTPESWQVKQQTHETYEKINNVLTPITEKERLREYQRQISSKLMTPLACDTIKDYRKEGW
jgi:hypothetical protein